jgi:hypothetical protein
VSCGTGVPACVPVPFFVAEIRRYLGTLGGSEPGLACRRRTSDTFSSVWQALYFLHVATTWAGVGRNER